MTVNEDETQGPSYKPNRKERRMLKAIKRRMSRRMLKLAYQELRRLREMEGEVPWRPSPLEAEDYQGE